MFKSNKISLMGVIASALAVAGNASAVVDVSGVTAEIAAAAAPVGLVGVAVLVAYAGLFAFRLIRRAL